MWSRATENTRCKILLVEDDDIDQIAFTRLVKDEGLLYDYVICSSVAGAKNVLSCERFDVVVMDYLLGDGVAFEIFDSIKDTPIIVTTGAGDEGIAVKAMKTGACDYLVKDTQRNYLKVLPLVIDNAIRNKRAADDLKQTHTQNEQLLGAIPSILVGIDPDYRITHWNEAAEKAFGIPAADVIGKPFFDCGIQWDWARIASWITDYHRVSSWSSIEDMRYIRPDGKTGCLSIKLNPFTAEAAEQSGFLLLAEDTTERKILESQLSEAQKLRSMGQLAAGIAHEVNTPAQHTAHNVRFLQSSFEKISKVLEKYQMLLKANKDGQAPTELVEQTTQLAEQADIEYLREQMPSAIEQSLDGIEQVVRIVQAMKEFAHPGTGDKKAVDINKAIESVIMVSRNYWKHVAEIRTDFDSELPPVSCFPDAVNQVILNMLVNAADAIAQNIEDKPQAKGIITIKTCQYANWVQIHMSDTGGGIPEEISDRIFEPFFTTKEPDKGTGQGLAICRALVDRLGGMITFDSTVNKGTTFTVHLPTESEPAKAKVPVGQR